MEPSISTPSTEADTVPSAVRLAHLQAVLEASSEGMIRLDRDGRAVTWNRAAAEVLSRPAELARGTALVDLFVDRALVQELLARCLGGEEVSEGSLELDREDGRRLMQVSLVPLQQRDRRTVGITCLLRDISEESSLRDALEREHEVSEDLRRLDTLKDEFLSTAAHELRTPLTSIAGFASLLARKAPERNEFVEPIERNARDMQRLVEALLDQARLESGRVTVEPTRFALAPAVERLLSDALEQLGGSHVVVEIADDASIDMDEQAFSLVLGNLVTNAAKYGAGGTITISARQRPDSTTVSVSDEGPGIPEEHQAHLFEPFFRVPGDQWSIRGTGFGLSIVRRYVELHNGDVTCQSSPGNGATFAFTVPTILAD